MREYIEKDALYSKLYDTPCDMVEIMELVENFPAADVVSVKRGKWLSWEEQFPEKKVPKKNKLDTLTIGSIFALIAARRWRCGDNSYEKVSVRSVGRKR